MDSTSRPIADFKCTWVASTLMNGAEHGLARRRAISTVLPPPVVHWLNDICESDLGAPVPPQGAWRRSTVPNRLLANSYASA